MADNIDKIIDRINNSDYENKEEEEKRRQAEKHIEDQRRKYREFIDKIPKIIEANEERIKISTILKKIDNDIPRVKGNYSLLSFITFIGTYVLIIAGYFLLIQGLLPKSNTVRIIIAIFVFVCGFFLALEADLLLNKGINKTLSFMLYRKRTIAVFEKYDITEEQYKTLIKRKRELIDYICANVPKWLVNGWGDYDERMEAIEYMSETYGDDIDAWKVLAEKNRKWEKALSYGSDTDSNTSQVVDNSEIIALEKKRLKMEKERLGIERKKAENVEDMRRNMKEEIYRNGGRWY